MFIKGVLTDFDGVLLDTFRDGMRRIKTICAIHEVPFTRETRAKLYAAWGMPGVKLLATTLDINETLAERMYTAWERLDKANPPPLIQQAREVLVWLRKNGFKTALITSRRQGHMRDMLDELDLDREFSVITSLETCGPYHKPDPRVFRYALERFRDEHAIELANCLFVGDTPSDTVAGHAAGLETLVVQTGPYLLEHIEQYPVKLGNVLKSIDDLPQWIEKHHEGELKTLYG